MQDDVTQATRGSRRVESMRRTGVFVLGLMVMATPVHVSAQVPGMTMEQDVDRPGSEFATATVSSPEQCAQRCLNDAACASYTARSDSFSFQCSLKNALAAPTPAAGAVSGIRQGDSLSLLTLNLSNHGAVAGVPWETRFARVGDWMARTRLRPDLLVLQELTGWRSCITPPWVDDYDQIDVLLGAILNRTGLPYRVAYFSGKVTGPTNPFPPCFTFGANAVLYRSDRLLNLTPGDSNAALLPHDAEPKGLHLRRSLPQCSPAAAFTWYAPFIDGSSVSEKCSSPSPTGPAWATMWDAQGYFGRNHYARFALRSDLARSIDVFNVHPLTDEPNYRGLMAIREMARTVRSKLRHRQPYYPPLMAGDFNTDAAQLQQVFADFDVAAWPGWGLPEGEFDVVGILAGRAGRHRERFGLRVDLVQRVPSEEGLCPGHHPDGLSDHCGAFVQFVNGGLTTSDIVLVGGSWWNGVPAAFSNGDGTFRVTNADLPEFAAWAKSPLVSRVGGDFDGDGRLDVALVGGTGWNTVPVAFSNGDGSFRVTNLPAGAFADWAATPAVSRLTGDFNGDGRSDLALTGVAGWNTIPVALSNGDGSFTVSNFGGGSFAGAAAVPGVSRLVGDFDGDGRADIALVGGAGWNTIPVAFSSATVAGAFWTSNLPAGIFPGAAAVPGVSRLSADFDGDGRADLALVGGAGWNTIPVALSNGGGTFTVSNLPAAAFASWAVTPGISRLSGDFNGDGRADLALVGGVGWNTVPVALSNGDGTFGVTNLPADAFAGAAALPGVSRLTGDFNGDGRTDFALVGGAGWNTLPVAFSNGNGSFLTTNSDVGGFASWATSGVASFTGEAGR